MLDTQSSSLFLIEFFFFFYKYVRERGQIFNVYQSIYIILFWVK